MTWISTKQIIKDLGLKSKPDDYDGLKRELRTKLAEIHPDKNGGAFSSPEDEELYNRISSAYEFVNLACRESTALIPVTQLPAIIKAVKDAQLAPTEHQVGQLRAECWEESRLDTHNRYALPRIGSGVFAAICASLFTFSGSLAKHPVLGSLAQNMTVQVLLLVMAAYAGIFFLMTWVRERKEEELIDYLMSETARREIFHRIMVHIHHADGNDSTSRQFSIRDVMKVIEERWGGHRRYSSSPFIILSVFLGSRGIKPSLIEKIAQIHLLEMEKRGAIHRIETPSMDLVYEFEDKLIT